MSMWRTACWDKFLVRARVAGLLALLAQAGGCVLPIPTIPLNLPAHGHTYEIRNAEGVVRADGILVIHTYYRYHDYYRADCYPIRNGQAVVPRVVDVRVTSRPMFPVWIIAPIVPTGFILWINPHHAHVYPFVPGHAPWNDFAPLIDDGAHLFGIKPRPKFFRMYPVDAFCELEHLIDVRRELEDALRILATTMANEEGTPSGYALHNERELKKALQYVRGRIEALAKPPRLSQIRSPQAKRGRR